MSIPKSEAFATILAGYLARIADLDLAPRALRLGLEASGPEVVIPFFGFAHRVSAENVCGPQGGRPSHAVSVILFQYLLLCPETETPGSDWVTYRDFRDAAPFVGGFRNTAQRPVAEAFAGRQDELRAACRRVNGTPADLGIAADLTMRFFALPRIPMALLFNDQDEEFPATCTLLFERRARHYLDMECLAMCGMVLARWLIQSHRTPPPWDLHGELL